MRSQRCWNLLDISISRGDTLECTRRFRVTSQPAVGDYIKRALGRRVCVDRLGSPWSANVFGVLSAVRANEKPHICESCGKAFSTKTDLKRHIFIHTNEKPHSCEQCGRAFSIKSKLKRHLLIHTKKKPHVCEVCNKAFAVKSNLSTHLLIHTKEKPYVCEICGKGFTQSGNLRRHFQTHLDCQP
ncbi:Zinc finger protein 91 [Araneus ventricosus]|uniref:Zinc finger protein 91 n=1 Tax=Araneus ventricosus TaxID=182803 RepID=A0A4Y2Q8R2_ARAVE|nr:Zinc finger protein 91 [Araneus ventricosus]